jgi:protein-S-isoprenylcysteine O-methyltransferase Ste14
MDKGTREVVAMFSVRRVPQQATRGCYPRFAAVAGTFLSVGFLLLPQQELSHALYLTSLFLVIAGTLFSICAVLVLGRSISIMPEARRLVTGGPYALVRHPLYLGEIVALAGIALQYLSGWALLLLGLVTVFQLQRMKIRGAGAIPKLSRIWRLHGADGPFGAGGVLVDHLAIRVSPNVKANG